MTVWSAEAILNCFISGLHNQNELAVFKPSTISQTIGLAKLKNSLPPSPFISHKVQTQFYLPLLRPLLNPLPVRRLGKKWPVVVQRGFVLIVTSHSKPVITCANLHKFSYSLVMTCRLPLPFPTWHKRLNRQAVTDDVPMPSQYYLSSMDLGNKSIFKPAGIDTG